MFPISLLFVLKQDNSIKSSRVDVQTVKNFTNSGRLVIPKLAFFTLTVRLRRLWCYESDTNSSFWWKLQFSDSDLRMNIRGILLKCRWRWRPHKLILHSVLQAILFPTPEPCCGSGVLKDCARILYEVQVTLKAAYCKIVPHSVLQVILFPTAGPCCGSKLLTDIARIMYEVQETLKAA
jgi:hypothetical protein